MNILFLADPNSIHDIKWITYFSEKHNCYLVSRDIQNHKPINDLSEFNINYVGTIKDYSTVKFWKNKYEAKKLASIIKSHQINVFHILYTEPNILWANYQKELSIPIIASNRGSDILVTINNTFKRKSFLNYFVAKNYKKAFSLCNWITCTSSSQINTIKILKLSQHIRLIRTGIDIALIDSLSNNKIVDGITKPYVLFPRNMRPVYNHELAIEAIKLLPTSIKSSFEFVFVDANSTDIEYVKKIKDLITTVEGTKIRFLNKLPQEEIIPLMKNASLAVMTNTSDGSPVSAMELMYLNTPVVLSPLQYDNELFGEIAVFPEFKTTILAEIIVSKLKTKNNHSTNSKNIIVKKGNRVKEMNKLELLYSQCIS